MPGEITPREFLARRSGGAVLTLLDVREDWEVELSPAPAEHLHMPMGEIPDRLAELDRGAEIVVLCRSGGRSMQVAHYLERQGYPSVHNLTGGILAWSHDLDPSIPVY